VFTRRSRGAWASLVTIAVIAAGLVVPTTAAIAAEGDPEYLTVSKSVSPAQVSPGQPFTYTIAVNCSEQSCLDATLHDALPAELAGYRIQNVSMQPGAANVPRDVTWTVDGAVGTTTPSVVTADTVLDVDFTGAISAPVGTGLQNGQTFTVTITLQVPADLPPGTQTITNTASTEASNSAPASDDATITVITPEIIDVDVTKTWSPSPQSFNPGSPSTIDLAVINASNGPVETLIVQEPSVAADSAANLDASNPFTITDFTGFGTAALPAGADAVQVDLYLQQADGTWQWVPGPPASAPEIPAGVAAADIGGIRLTYTGTAIAEGASGTVAIEVEQRATHRNTDADLSTAAHAVDNVVQGTAAVEGRDPETDTATADYRVIPASIAAATIKTIEPGRIAAGDSASSRIVGTNTSDVGVNELRVADLDFFDEDIAFAGFRTAPVWPSAADAGVLRYYPLDGGESIEVTLTEGVNPPAPGVPISGFEFVFTAADGGIESGASAVIDFTIQTSEDAIGDAEQRTVTNSATTSVLAQNGVDADATDTADLTLLEPKIDVTLAKTIRPSGSVAPGEPVVTELAATLTTTSDYITPSRIVIEDAWSGAGSFWDGFDLSSIAPTQVPSNTALTIEVQDANGDWRELQVFPAQDQPHLISMTEAEVVAALPAGVDIDQVRGIRFTFDNEAPEGFAAGVTVTPYVVSEARSDLRSGGATVPGDDEPVAYENRATTTGSGSTGGGTPLTDTDEDQDTATIETVANEGPLGIDKRWSEPTVSAQSGQLRGTTLSWRVDPGYGRIVITDPAPADDAFDPTSVPGAVSGTVYDAFDLVRINAIPANSDPFSNGWYMQYDIVDAVELYIGEAWQTVPAPAAGWIQNGAFVGYVLSDAERADATGFRIVLSPDDQARADAEAAGDPWVTAIGEGVGSSSAVRTFDLTWQIRDQKRSDGEWVTDKVVYNADDAGLVDNTVRIDGEGLVTGAVQSDVDDDTILITNPGPGVTVRKSVTPTTPLHVPRAGSEPSSYPTAQFTLEARNDSVSKASYIRVTDPPVCADGEAMSACQSAGTVAGATADPFTDGVDWLTAPGQGNPFDRFDLRKVTVSAAIADQVDLAASTVWLLRYSAGAYTTEQTTAAAVNALDAAALADVVGVSVTFQGTDPEVTGGTITPANVLRIVMDTQLRPEIRSSGAAQTVVANDRVGVANRVFAQSYDPILSDGALTGARDAAAVTLTGGDLNVAPSKTVSPDALTEPTKDAPVTVTLGANQGTDPVSTLSPAEVRLTDDTANSPEFWDAFDFTGLGTIAAPAGADRVTVAVYGPFGTDGADAWVASEPTTIAQATVPVETDRYAEIEGVRFAFSRADGAFFSPTVPAPAWTARAAFTVELRDAYRESGDEVVLAGSVPNTVTVISDRLNGETSAEKSTSASIALSPGTFGISVNKEVNDGASHFATAGDLVPWDLAFTNTGTGYLTIEELRDLLPSHLVYLGDEPVYTVDPDGLLPEPQGLTEEDGELVFTWAPGSRMAPGETFSVRVLLQLQPGLGIGQQAINQMTVHTTENLASCTNSVPGGTVTGAWAADDTTCGTTEYVTPANATSLFVVKGVRGERQGAIYPGNPDRICQQNLVVTGGAYFRSPCAANSEIGGTDSWVLRAQNGGTSEMAEMVLFDQLPVAGDRSLISGASRGSAFRPQLLDDLAVNAPQGTTTVIEVTTSTGVCTGTWGNLVNQEPCAQNGEVWSVANDDTDWSTVSGIRVSLDFRSTPARALTPGQFVDVTYSSTNVAVSADNPTGAPTAVPAADTFAWNQFGVKFRDTDETAFQRIAPSPVGVHLVVGALRVDKLVTGPAAGYAPDEFRADVVCTIDGAPVDLGEAAVVVLDEGNGYSRRIDGIPFGSSCTVAEQGETGSYGEASRSGSPTTVLIDDVTEADDEIPTDSVVQLANDYAYSGLSVTKLVDTDAVAGAFGPFDFTLTCTTEAGFTVAFGDGVSEATFTLEAGETYTAPENTIPARSTCEIAEVGSSAADTITVTGTGVTDLGEGVAEVEVGTTPAAVTITNSYDTGVLTVVKNVDGEGAALYGAGPFTFTAVCTYRGQEILDLEFALEANSQRTFGPYPTSTSCIVEETDAAGATRTALDPSDGTVTLGEGTDPEWTVTATNFFDLTSIVVTKERIGDLDAEGADGTFPVELQCSLPAFPDDRLLLIPGGAVRELSAAGGYTATYESLPVDAVCEIVETDAGTAVRTAITVATSTDAAQTTDGTRASIDLTDAVAATEVQVTNEFVKDLPQTGFAGGPWVWSAMLLLLGGGALLLVRSVRRRGGALTQ
jgi:fimbrial isopeptide formation D2 family protein